MRVFGGVLSWLILASTAVQAVKVTFTVNNMTDSQLNFSAIKYPGYNWTVVEESNVSITISKKPSMLVYVMIDGGAAVNETLVDLPIFGGRVVDYRLSRELSNVTVKRGPRVTLVFNLTEMDPAIRKALLEQFLIMFGSLSNEIMEFFSVSVDRSCPEGMFQDLAVATGNATSTCKNCTLPGPEEFVEISCGIVGDAVIRSCAAACGVRYYEYCPCNSRSLVCPIGDRVCFPYALWNASVVSMVSTNVNQSMVYDFAMEVVIKMKERLLCDYIVFWISNKLGGRNLLESYQTTSAAGTFNITFQIVNGWMTANTSGITDLSFFVNQTKTISVINTQTIFHDISCPWGRIVDSFSGAICLPDLCPPGTAGPPGFCSPCDVGYYQNDTGAYYCLPCEPGTYAPSNGSLTCQRCPENQTSAQAATGCRCDPGTSAPSCYACVSGSYSIQDARCHRCMPGSYSRAPRSTTCVACNVNRFASGYGTTACLECAAGSFANKTGSTTCKWCLRRGESYRPSIRACVPCDAGQYEENGDCHPCPRGAYSGQKGSTVCLGCPQGLMTAGAGSTVCLPCLPGTYGQNCTPCPLGTYNPQPASSACLPCASGTFVGYEGASSEYECLNCREGTYFSGGLCVDCPLGMTSARGSQAVDECWPPDGYFGEISVGIFRCPPNNYCHHGAKKPSPCPPGQSSDAGAVECSPSGAGVDTEMLRDVIIIVCWSILFIFVIALSYRLRLCRKRPAAQQSEIKLMIKK